MTLNENDKRILRALQRDASLNRKNLAEDLSMSQSTIWRRINDFEKAGLIVSQVTLLDPRKVGANVCIFVSINVVSHEDKCRKAFEKFVMNAPQILECFSVTGAHDYTLIIRAESVDQFEIFLMNTILAHKSVATASSQVALRQHKYTTEIPL